MNKPKLHVVSFSGGKDSTAMLLRMLEEGMPVDLILYCDTGVEFPEMEAHINKVEKYIGREITRIKSDKDFMYYACEHERVITSTKIPGVLPGQVTPGYGWPSVFSRWRTRAFKTTPIENRIRELKKEYDVIQYIGIAADEPRRIKDKRYPLVEWGMTEADCIQYCYDRGFDWGGLYKIWDRVSCWCCPLQGLEDLRKLKEHYPELWDRLKEMERQILLKAGPTLGPRRYFQHSRGVEDLERRFEVEDEFKAQGKKTNTREFYNALKAKNIRY